MAILHKTYGFDFETMHRDFSADARGADRPFDALKKRARDACRDKTAASKSLIHMLIIDEEDADEADTYLLALSSYFAREDSISVLNFSVIELWLTEAEWLEKDVRLLLAGKSLVSLMNASCDLKNWEYPLRSYIGWLELKDIERLAEKLGLCRALIEQPNSSLIETVKTIRDMVSDSRDPRVILKDAYLEVLNRFQVYSKSKLSMLLVNDITSQSNPPGPFPP